MTSNAGVARNQNGKIPVVIASLSPLGAGFFLKEQFTTCPGIDDVLVGTLPA